MITPSGVVTEYPIPTSGGSPHYIIAGSDNNLWFTEYTSNKIGMITPSGVVTEYPIPTSDSSPYGIAKGPDGNMWFTENDGNNIGVLKIAQPQAPVSEPSAAPTAKLVVIPGAPDTGYR